MKTKERFNLAIETYNLVHRVTKSDSASYEWFYSPNKSVDNKLPVDVLCNGTLEDIRDLQSTMWGIVNGSCS